MNFTLYCFIILSLLSLHQAYAADSPTAQLPSSGNVSESYLIKETDYDQESLIEILASPNNTFRLKFGNLPGQSNPHSLGIIHVVSETIVWYTYRDHKPGQYDNLGGSYTVLNFTSTGDLAIYVQGNGVDVLVWQTATSGKDVRTMQLTDDGNLVLFNSSRGIVWQSYDYPTDTILTSQKLPVGKSLLVPARNGYPFIGTNYLSMETYRLVAYVDYGEAEPYWELSATSTNGNKVELSYAAIVNGTISVFNKQGNLVASKGNITNGAYSSVLQRFSIENDGNIKLYGFENSSSSWVKQLQVIVDACKLPDDCGYSANCAPGQACACPQTYNLISTLNGCVASRSLDCNSKYGNNFEKVTAASYFAATYNSSKLMTGLSLDECKSLCTSNCSCLGFVYGTYGTAKGACLTTIQLRTYSASVDGSYTDAYAYDLYVRVQGKARSPLAIILGVCIPVAVIIFLAVLWWYVRVRVRTAAAEEEEFLLQALPGLPPRYSYGELKHATKNFSQRIGGGSFGSVYEGVLSDGNAIAVKQLEGKAQGKKEFHAEVATIGTVRHLNLVRLRGFCLEKNHRLLVYEHMSLGSLDRFLFRDHDSRASQKRNAPPPLNWEQRQRIAIGVAKALAYLHEGSPECIIHCDIKPENVLISENGEAKLSDFGLSKLMNRQLKDNEILETNVRGTRGYLAPEWLHGGRKITEKADVYSYGVLLLEILTGRRNFDTVNTESSMSYFPDWALRNLVEDDGTKMEFVLDKSIQEDTDIGDARRAMMVALWCLQEDPNTRPAMSRVVRMLEGESEVPTPPAVLPDDSIAGTPMAFETARTATSEVAMPFLRRVFFPSSSSTSTSTIFTPSRSPHAASAVY